MLIANVNGRLHLMASQSEGIDVEQASDGQFSADPQAIYERWDEFRDWASGADLGGAVAVDPADIDAPTPAPRQIFALGLNYRDHAEEVGLDIPEDLTVFTKFSSSFCGPIAEVKLPEGGLTDWETELIVVLARGGRDIAEDQAWDYVAGITMGQDLSERRRQGAGTKQFSIAKSFENFSPMGPVVASPDEFANRDDIALGCQVNGVVRQDGHTRDMIFPVPEAIARLSQIVELYPGDIIWTGTPAGVGQGQKPKMIFLNPGDVVESSMDVVGTMRQTFS
ncbi:fumarylacetoacetate hydrolase [Epidermidibacterium keratini]|uniref:Fumarylacetoacetate hydrolase n=1 Tax=Epidermidibacterium keratini TaxID=1891644 RepID=A0A7L4YLX2_9ACTN|nr:fumarylacetoacetate hydrolase family protein [Epidermidibacterium keratini]QHC00176.1 fumarylacetoacetate hydrolase [Epidermidibacterium keratini]